jgi:KipI family sensor histidine kinase inhibitor
VTSTAARICRLGEHLVLVELGTTIDDEVNRRVLALAAWVRQQHWPGVLDVVPAFASVGLHLAPPADGPAIEQRLRERLGAMPAAADEARGTLVEIPVRYGGRDGPDLDEVAALCGLSRAEVVERHVARTYRVFMLGFLPGFAYLGTLDPAIEVPRRLTPRTAVESGSVGLAGAQTGVYPRVSPGGWQIIGRTDVTLFDPGLDPPARLAPGDRVRFVPLEIVP